MSRNAITTQRGQAPAQREQMSREEQVFRYMASQVNALMDMRGMERTEANRAKALREVRMVVQSFRRTPKLFDCDPESVWDCVADAAGLGLELGGAAAECALVPFKNTCQLIVEYGGKIKLMLQHPLVAEVNAQIVHAADEFEYDPAEQTITHRRPFNVDRGQIIAAYAIVKLTTGGRRVCVMDRLEIYEHGCEFSGTTWDPKKRKMVFGEEGFLVKWWDESPQKRRAYCLKTVVHMVAKTVPKSAQLGYAMRLDDAQAEEARQQAPTIEAEYEPAEPPSVPPAPAEEPPPEPKPQRRAPAKKQPEQQSLGGEGPPDDGVPFPDDDEIQ